MRIRWNIAIRVVVHKDAEEKTWVAQGLEYDLRATGTTPDEASDAFKSSLLQKVLQDLAEAQAADELGEAPRLPLDDLDPAPSAEFHRLLGVPGTATIRRGTCGDFTFVRSQQRNDVVTCEIVFLHL